MSATASTAAASTAEPRAPAPATRTAGTLAATVAAPLAGTVAAAATAGAARAAAALAAARPRLMRLPLLALPLVAACQPQPPAEPHAQKAWIRLPAVPGRPAAGYMTLVGGRKDATLVAITTPRAARTELHESMKMGAAGHAGTAPHTADPATTGPAATKPAAHGMPSMSGATTMRPIKALPLPAGQTVKLAPGGYHLMLYDFDASIVPGGAVPLRLHFADGTSVLAEAKAVAAGDEGLE
jgi:copper(I)-binding protein